MRLGASVEGTASTSCSALAAAAALPAASLSVFRDQVLGMGARRRGAGDKEVGVGEMTIDGLTFSEMVGIVVVVVVAATTTAVATLVPLGVLVLSFFRAVAVGGNEASFVGWRSFEGIVLAATGLIDLVGLLGALMRDGVMAATWADRVGMVNFFMFSRT